MEALERNNWNQSKTAKEIGMHRNNIIFKINALGLRDRIQAKTGRPANEKAEA
jgi:transcriptional regulator with GAF, ATPase, and Fis domain